MFGMRVVRICGAVVVMLCVATVHGAVLRDGTEFQINTIEEQNQESPAVVAAPGGGFLVVWDGSEAPGRPFRGILGQRLDTRGRRLGTEFQLSTSRQTYGQGQFKPEVAAYDGGGFVTVWDTYGLDGSFEGVAAQRVDADGSRLGTEFQINTYTTYSQYASAVGVVADDQFVVAWMDTGYFGASGTNLFAQRFDKSATRIGTEFQIPATVAHEPVFAALAELSGGGFVVAWTSFEQDGSDDGITAQRFGPQNEKLGAEILVNTYTTGAQRRAAVASKSDGSFSIVWHSSGQDGDSAGVFGQSFDANGQKIGSEFQANQYTFGAQERPKVAFGGDGSFVVAWNSVAQDGSARGVFARRFGSSGLADGPEFQVNSYTTGNQGGRRGDDLEIAIDDLGRILVVWTSENQDSDQEAIIGEMFCVDTPANAICGDVTCVGGPAITTVDAMTALRAGIGLDECDLCRCDANGSTQITSSDALLILALSVGQAPNTHCPACGG